MKPWLKRVLIALPALIAFLSIAALYLDSCTCGIPDEWEFLAWFSRTSSFLVTAGAAAGQLLAVAWKLIRRFKPLRFNPGFLAMAYAGACTGVVETVREIFELRAREGM